MIWFTSDFHYGHKNICGPEVSRWPAGYRDFHCLYDMNEAIVKSVNDNVDKHDTLYFLGDWAFGGEQNIEELKNRLNVKVINFIYGNHDKAVRRNYKHLFTETHDLLHRVFEGTLFALCHYPIAEWQDCHKGSIHLYGHVHGNKVLDGKALDVGWCSHRRPLSLDEIFDIMKDKPILGHH